ncbi:MAG: hypothetical protein H7211_00760 [Aquabacterium sp.]|nr:hypothetical protein [Ferruginibacter sp.]
MSWLHKLLPIFTGTGAGSNYSSKTTTKLPATLLFRRQSKCHEDTDMVGLIAPLLLSHIHYQNKSKMAFSNMVSILRMHLQSYISIKGLLALHYRKRPYNKKIKSKPDLFSQF